MIISDNTYGVELVQEPRDRPENIFDTRRYKRQLDLSCGKFQTTNYGLYLNNIGEFLISSEYPSTLHGNSAVIQDQCLYLGIGNQICKINLLTKEKEWNIEVDMACCFGVHYEEGRAALISHGEVTITRLTTDGLILWRASGRDIFTEGFELKEDYIETIDFEKNIYYFDYETGNEIRR
jgi:hypothetical protein